MKKTFVDRLIAFSLGNRYIIFMLVGALLAVGLYSFNTTPIEAFPDITNTQITIITQWPGKSAEEVERFVTIPTEVGMNFVQKKIDLRSSTLFGLSVVTLIFDDGVEDFFARQQVMNALQNVNFPDNIQPNVLNPFGPTGEIYRFTLQSNSRTLKELNTLEQWVVERNILSVPGVADISSFGGETKTYEASINPQKLVSLNINPNQVLNALQRANLNVGADVMVNNGQAFVVRGMGLLKNIKEMENVLVDNQNGVPILMKDIATIHESNLTRLGIVAKDTIEDVVSAIVLMRKGENPSDVLKLIEKKVTELNSRILPADVKIVPYYSRQNLINYASHTVLHNMFEGMIFVTVIVFLFMADWRTTLVVGLVIPLSLLFAFTCIKAKGMYANLLSMGAVDFGIIIDGAVVMVEGIFVALDSLAQKIGMERFNKMSKIGLIKHATASSGKAIFYAKLIILTGLIPIFAFQKVEAKVFAPLAYTLGFALLGALILTLTFVPLLASLLLRKNVREKHNPFVEYIIKERLKQFQWGQRNKKSALLIGLIALLIGIGTATQLGTEFLPQLNEGSLWIRVTMPMSVSLNESAKMANDMRQEFASFSEVRQSVSQTGRPDDGTDPAGFYNLEFFVDLYPQSEWKDKESKEELIARMQKKLYRPGIILNFSQPIMDNVEEAASGVKGSICVKIFGDDIDSIEHKAFECLRQMKTVQGIEDLGIVKNIGAPELRVQLNQEKMAAFGVTTSDAQTVLQMAIGGQAATTIYEGNKMFDLRARYLPEYRNDEKAIANLMVPTLRGTYVQMKEIADISRKTGPILIFRQWNRRYAAVKFSVRGRDMGGAVSEAQAKVNKNVKLPPGYEFKWAGDFENQERALARLKLVVPITLILIVIILFTLFKNIKDVGLVFLNVPFGAIGGIVLLAIRHINFSISAGIGFVALFGISVQSAVIIISKMKSNLEEGMRITEAIKHAVEVRIRPVVMTALMGAIGLLPAALSTGIGSESARPLATVICAGLITDIMFDIMVLPVIFYFAYHKKYADRGAVGSKEITT